MLKTAPSIHRAPPASMQLFLCLVALWDGFDLAALSQTLPDVRATFGMTIGQGGRLLALASIGTVFGYFLLRKADSLGRRPVLLLSVLGYSLASLASGAASSSSVFLAAQLVSRIFIVSALSTAALYAAEDFPRERRAQTISMLVAVAAFGGVICALLAPRMVGSRFGWRGLYYLGGSSVVLFVYGWFFLRETRHFSALETRVVPSLTSIWRAGHGRRIFLCSLLWILTYGVNQSAVAFWKEHAVADLHISQMVMGGYIAIAAFVSIPLAGIAGPVLDRIGRRRGSAIVYLLQAIGVIGSYLLPHGPMLRISLILLVSGASGALVIANTVTAESFPTEQRGNGMAWTNSLLGRIGFILSPFIVSAFAEKWGWARTVPWLALLPLCSLALIWRMVQEDKHAATELETAKQIVLEQTQAARP